MSILKRFAVHARVDHNGQLVHVVDADKLGGSELRLVETAPGVRAYAFIYTQPLNWPKPMFARVVFTRRTVRTGECVPPWYYALGYENIMRDEAVFFFLPVAVMVRLLRWVEFIWTRARCRPSWFDVQLADTAARRRRE